MEFAITCGQKQVDVALNSPDKSLDFLKRELSELLPPTIYFMIAFNIVELTTALALRSFEIQVSAHAGATILALVVGKVVLIANKLPLLRAFDDRPLITPIVFKTVVYSVLVLIVRLLEEWLPALIDTGGLGAATDRMATDVNWWLFAVAQIWTFFLFLAYITVTEVGSVFGLSRQRLYVEFVKERPAD